MGCTRFFSLAGVFIFCCLSSWAQENRYIVFFKDKQGVSQSISRPIEFLSERAIQRRLAQGISVNEADLPVNPSYLQGVKNTGAIALYTTRWMNGVLVTCDPSQLDAIESLAYVERIEYVAPPAKQSSGGRRSFNLKKNNLNLGAVTETQLKMIGIDRMQLAGYTGSGIVIAVLDSGFPGVNQVPAFDHMFSDGRFDAGASYDFVHHTPEVFHYDDHGTEVLSVIAGQIPDGFTGGAYDATFQLFITEDVPTEYRVEEYNWLFAAERADSAGADIIHSSLGYYDFDDATMNYGVEDMDGKTAVVTRAAQWAAERGIVVITSAGNEGSVSTWRIITAPADAESVLAVGGVNETGKKVSSSSIGPAADGRTKPDVVALGMAVRVVRATGQISASSGTSLAAPLITSLAAGIMQRYPELSSGEIIDLLRHTSSQANKPDHLLGFGIPNFQAVVNFQDHIPQQQKFEVYPNPLKDRDTLIIRPQDPEILDSCQIEVLSSQGEILSSASVRFDWLNRTYRTTLANLGSGVYYVRIRSQSSNDTFKVVKLR